MIVKLASATIGLFMLLFSGCVGDLRIAGTVTDTGNPVIIGRIVDTLGNAASGVQIFALPDGYDPVADRAIPDSMMDTTNEFGRFVIRVPAKGIYNIQAFHLAQRTRLLIKDINASHDSTTLPADTLRKPGTIKVVLPNGIDTTNGYLYLPGTTNYSLLSNTNGTAMQDSIPAGVRLSIYYAVRGSSAQPRLVRDSVIVPSGGMMTVEYVDWKYSKKIVLNTTASGADVAGMVTDFPVLARLTSGNFNFAQAKSGGEDVRFTKSDGTPLLYEIERWDASAQQAEIWVKVDTIFGNNSTQYITMFWGNTNATSLSNSVAVFDTGKGFQGVWHLNEASGLVAKDATGNHYDGTPSDTAPSAVTGTIGIAKGFNGISSSVQMKGTADSKLNFPKNGYYSVSVWVNADTLNSNRSQLIVGKGHYQYFLKLYSDWEFTEYVSDSTWQITNTPPVARQWKYLVGTREGNTENLYLDGTLVNTNTFSGTISNFGDTGSDVSIGRYLQYVTEFNQGFAFFNGAIDEVRISNVSRSADWIRLCFMNQTANNALVEFR
jgi:hypothetical protein